MACPHHVSAPWNPRAVWYARRAGGVCAATGKLRESGHWGTRARPWVLDFSEAVPGFYTPVTFRFSKRPVKIDAPYCHQSKAHQNGELSQVNEMKKEIRQLNFGESLRFHGLSGNFD